MLSLRKKWGDRGYGWMWVIRELMLEQKSNSIHIEKKEMLLLATDADPDTFFKFLVDLVDIGILAYDGEYLWCPQDLAERQQALMRNKKNRITRAYRQNRIEDAEAIAKYYGLNNSKRWKGYKKESIKKNQLLREIL